MEVGSLAAVLLEQASNDSCRVSPGFLVLKFSRQEPAVVWRVRLGVSATIPEVWTGCLGSSTSSGGLWVVASMLL